MREIPNDELKVICVNILKRFNELCKDHNLKYSLAYGTLIGAVRHKGFIPWDDDIDVIMPREDYEKLLALKYDDGDFEIKSCRYSKDYYYMFAKMVDKHTCLIEEHIDNKNMGVYIDIFPYDRVSPDSPGFDRLVNKSMKYKKLSNHLISSGIKKDGEGSFHHIIKKIIQSAVKPLRKPIINYMDKNFAGCSGDYYLNLVNNDCNTMNLILADFWDNLIDIEFEHHTMKAFKDYDKVLTSRYGSYMQLPPESEQVSNHNFTAYYKN